jgi:hypothetical protein
MHTVIQQLLISQYEASLSMLAHGVALCPQELWQVPVARYSFSQVAFHTLFFTDFYLCRKPEDLQVQPFHQENAALFGDYEQLLHREPTAIYERPQIERYLAFCRDKARLTVNAETASDLAEATMFPRRTGTRAEGHVYNIRHIQHHVGQLSLRLRLEDAADVPWIGHGWREPPSGS